MFIALLLAVFVLPAGAAPNSATLSSPGGRVELTIETEAGRAGEQLAYSVKFDGREVVVPSGVKLIRKDGVAIGGSLVSVDFGSPATDPGEWEPLFGERSGESHPYSEQTIQARDDKANCSYAVTFRCFDAGVAFRTKVTSDKPFAIKSEQTEFRFASDAPGWRTTNAQGLYDKVPISQMGKGVERPLVLELGESAFAAITEANLVDYARMQLRTGEASNSLVSQLSGGIQPTLELTTPWRVVMVAKSPGKLLENNGIVPSLAEPNQIADTSWIRPGKVLRDMSLTTAGGMACIDYAVEHDFKYVEFDAGWYGHEYDSASDATTITIDPKRTDGPFDLHGMIAYAKERGIGIIVYVNRRALEKQLDEILPLYKSWGIKGVKYGFVQVGSQKWTTWLHDAVRKAAEHGLLVDIHDEYRPTGFSRTYPNLMTQEGVRGDEATPSTEQALVTLFTRTLAGATDFTVCYFNPRVDEHWSHAQQLAKPVCFYSPWQFLFWYDSPLEAPPRELHSLRPTPEQEFFKHVPTVWDDTRVLHGAIGEYAVIARRSGADWFLGAMNNHSARTLNTSLDFLDEGVRYEATIYSDDESVGTITGVRIDKRPVTAADVLPITMEANGGQAIRITPLQTP